MQKGNDRARFISIQKQDYIKRVRPNAELLTTVTGFKNLAISSLIDICLLFST